MYENELYHFGVKGMKWGVRRYQNKDGRLTEAGKKRLAEHASTKDTRDIVKSYESERSKIKDDDYLEKNKLAVRYIRDHAKTLLKDLRLKDNDAAIADSVRALEKAQLKRDIDNSPEVSALIKSGYKLEYDNYDCTVSKNIKGFDVEISIAQRKDFVPRLVDNPAEVVKVAESFVEKELAVASNKITKRAYEDLKPYLADDNGEMGNISEQEFSSRINPYYIRIDKNSRDNKYGCEVGYDDDGMLGYHSIDVGYNISDNKVSYISLNG